MMIDDEFAFWGRGLWHCDGVGGAKHTCMYDSIAGSVLGWDGKQSMAQEEIPLS